MWEKNCFKLQWVCVWEREGWREKRERQWEGEKRKREDGKYLKILKLFNIFFENSKSPSSLSFLKCCILISVVIFLVSLWDFFKCCICPWIIIHPENCQWWLAENTPQYAAYLPKKKKKSVLYYPASQFMLIICWLIFCHHLTFIIQLAFFSPRKWLSTQPLKF